MNRKHYLCPECKFKTSLFEGSICRNCAKQESFQRLTDRDRRILKVFEGSHEELLKQMLAGANDARFKWLEDRLAGLVAKGVLNPKRVENLMNELREKGLHMDLNACRSMQVHPPRPSSRAAAGRRKRR